MTLCTDYYMYRDIFDSYSVQRVLLDSYSVHRVLHWVNQRSNSLKRVILGERGSYSRVVEEGHNVPPGTVILYTPFPSAQPVLSRPGWPALDEGGGTCEGKDGFSQEPIEDWT